MRYDELRQKIVEVQKAQAILSLVVSLFIKNKDIPLEERWDIFSRSWNILPNLNYGDGNIALLGKNLTLFDDFYVERKETVTYPRMYESVLEWIADNEHSMTKEIADTWREAVLEEAYYSFTYDW